MVDEMIVHHASHTGSQRQPARAEHRALRGPRRWRVPVLLSALLLIAASPAAATPRANTRTEALPAGHALAVASRATARASARTTVIDLRRTRRFELVGLKWSSAIAPLSAELRARRSDGSWTDWLTVESQQGRDGVVRGADGAEGLAGASRAARSGLRGSSEPLWTGASTRLQVRVRGTRPAGLGATFVNVTGERVLARAAAARQTDQYAGIQPRTTWDPGNTCTPRTTPEYGAVKAIAVHHTVGSNDYSQAEVPAIILGICKYHRDSNGWNDIGYNYLVDRYGGAWEGRAGGITQPVVGAQAQGFNAQTAGISMLGTFTAVAPTPLQVATVARVAAWRLAVAGEVRSGTIALTSAGGSLSRYKAGEVATEPRVMGHRDVGQTECPGDAAYALLDSIRAAVAAADPTLPSALPPPPVVPKAVSISITTQKSVTAGQESVVTGRALQGTASLAKATVALQVGSGDDWQTVERATTSSSGKFSMSHRFSRSWSLRVVRTDGDGGVSKAVAMTLVPRLTLTVPKRLPLNKATVLRGTIAPGRGPVKLIIERRTSNGKYAASTSVNAKVTGRRVTVSVTPKTATLYRFRLQIAASDLSGAGASDLAFGRAVSATSGGGAAVGK